MTLAGLMSDLFERRCFGGLVVGRAREGLGGWWDRPEVVERGSGGSWTRLWEGLQLWEDGLGFTTQLTIVFLEERRPRDPDLRKLYDTLRELRVADLPEGAVLDSKLSDDESVHYRVGGVHVIFDREPERVFKIVVSV